MLIVLNESGIAKTVTVADCHCNHCHCNHCHCNHRRLYLCWPVQLVGGTETVLNYYPIAGVCRLEVDLKLLSQIQKWWIMTFMCQLDYCHPKTLCMSSVKHTINGSFPLKVAGLGKLRSVTKIQANNGNIRTKLVHKAPSAAWYYNNSCYRGKLPLKELASGYFSR